MEHIEVHGLRVAYQRAGEGPPVVLLHGGVSDHREWQAQIQVLAEEFTVVAWDAPGCGASADPPEAFGMAGYARCLAGLLEALRLEKPAVIGLSFGATLALELYRHAPGVAGALVLASAYAGWAGSLPADEVAARVEKTLSDLRLPPEDFVRPWVSTLFTEAAPSEAVARTAAIMADFHPPGVRAMVRAMAAADLRPVLSRIDVPTLLLYGEADVRSPLAVAEEMRDSISGSRLVVLPGVGHQCNVEAPGSFTTAVQDFLRVT